MQNFALLFPSLSLSLSPSLSPPSPYNVICLLMNTCTRTHAHACQQCHVSLLHCVYPVLLQAGDAYQVMEGSQFVVSRTAFRDNSSHYQLNGRKVAFKEVASLLRSCGIDLDHNRFLILQVSTKLMHIYQADESQKKSPTLSSDCVLVSCLQSSGVVYIKAGVGAYSTVKLLIERKCLSVCCTTTLV